ncbi:hypothetical protein [Shewanella ulleungensis]|jgi:hypothetical protein|uniref:Uncharacterized protein n=1 Tax=Shewanella ulleungensis TaxID=2282699 RepID=A0ABQ2QEW9_9GAMM|nr:hypothetical protein [Shewanella ulleungensis]MCL1149406.1 hypothetical protein [Shewanella ulleungensis]GGP78942.1 hypothetical protein GCM10009410_09060 [Shewanella ulleungensis]
MDKKTKGAWIVHHAEKLKTVTNADNEFEQINFAGKCGILLSSLSSDSQHVLDEARVSALARAANINVRTELPSFINELQRQRLISTGTNAIEVLGMQAGNVLEHISRIFDESEPKNKEQAVIVLAESCSELPMDESRAKEYISDTFKFDNKNVNDLFHNVEYIGFVDSEETFNNKKLLFNGNIFRGANTKKAYAIISAMSSIEAVKIQDINDRLARDGCLSVNIVKKILGDELFIKAQSIALFDVNAIGNETGKHEFVTRPSAFNKYSNSTVDDAFDLAKAFVTSLTYGMTARSSNQGRIQMITVLLSKLINGYWIGPATAIGQDYQILEFKGVVKVERVVGNQCRMKLLKREVGELALQVINDGDASQNSLTSLPSVSATTYLAPESTRQLIRKNQTGPMKRNVGEILNQLRTGGI